MITMTTAPISFAFIPRSSLYKLQDPDCYLPDPVQANNSPGSTIGLGVPVRPKPAHRVFKRGFRRRLGYAQLADGLAAIIMHAVFGHFDPFQRNARRLSGQLSHPLVHMSERQYE